MDNLYCLKEPKWDPKTVATWEEGSDLNQKSTVMEILDRYFLKAPAKSLDADAFYLKPLPKKLEDPDLLSSLGVTAWM